MMKGRIVRLIPLSLVAAVIYGWLSAVTKMTPFNLMYIGSAAGMAFVVYLIFAFLLDRFDETLAIWFGIYLAALVVFLCIR
jgi:hypothetical protein